MKTLGRVNGIISNIVIAKVDGPVGQNEICHVYCGDVRMMAEVIKVIGDEAYVQVYDSTRGLKIGDKVEFEGHMLEATLAPGLLSRNYDGLQNDLEKMDGLFIARGSITDPVDFEKVWEFKPLAKVGDKVTVGIRPEYVSLGRLQKAIEQFGGEKSLELKFNSDEVERLGNNTYVYGTCCGVDNFKILLPGDVSAEARQSLEVSAAVKNVLLFDAEDKRIYPNLELKQKNEIQ